MVKLINENKLKEKAKMIAQQYILENRYWRSLSEKS